MMGRGMEMRLDREGAMVNRTSRGSGRFVSKGEIPYAARDAQARVEVKVDHDQTRKE